MQDTDLAFDEGFQNSYSKGYAVSRITNAGNIVVSLLDGQYSNNMYMMQLDMPYGWNNGDDLKTSTVVKLGAVRLENFQQISVSSRCQAEVEIDAQFK